MKCSNPTQEDIHTLMALLRHECNFAFSEYEMTGFLNTGTALTLNSGETIIEAGDVNCDIYFIIDGITQYWYWNGDREKTAFFSQAGTMLISYHSYYFGKGSFYNVSACCRTRILCIKKEVYDRFIATSHSFSQWCLSMAQCQLFFFEMKNRIITGTAKERYVSFIKSRPDIMRRVPLKIIASYLDVTPQYLSTLRRSI